MTDAICKEPVAGTIPAVVGIETKLSDPVADPTSSREWLAKLVSFDTTSSKSNVPFIQFVASYVREALKGAPGTPSGSGAKVLVEYGPSQRGISYANLVLSIPSFAPAQGEKNAKESEGDDHNESSAVPAAGCDEAPNFTGGFALSGHSDVVPVDGQVWDSNPFTLTEKDGKLYGRGTCDMKGFLAVVLSLVPEWANAMREHRFRKPLHLILTYSEETDLEGAHQLLRDGSESWRRLQSCEGVVIGEPTMMEIVIAHKGVHENYVTCKGTAVHSSQQTKGFNAIEPATSVLQFLFDLRTRFETDGPYDDDFEVPYTTLCPGQLVGGQALNTTPELCKFGYQFRNVPGHSHRAVEREIRAFIGKKNESVQAIVRDINASLSKQVEAKRVALGDAAAAVPTVTASVELGPFTTCPHFQGDPDTAIVKALQRAVVEDGKEHGDAGSGTDKEGKPRVGQELKKMSFYTEAGYFQRKGLNTVVCGPGNIEQAHKANEFISVEQLAVGVRVIRKLVQDLCF